VQNHAERWKTTSGVYVHTTCSPPPPKGNSVPYCVCVHEEVNVQVMFVRVCVRVRAIVIMLIFILVSVYFLSCIFYFYFVMSLPGGMFERETATRKHHFSAVSYFCPLWNFLQSHSESQETCQN